VQGYSMLLRAREERKSEVARGREAAMGVGHEGEAQGSDEVQGGVAESGQQVGGDPSVQAILAVGAVADVVQAVLNPPVAAQAGRDRGRACRLGRQAGEPGVRLDLFPDGRGRPAPRAAAQAGLSDPGPVVLALQVAAEVAGLQDPQLPSLNPPVALVEGD
jgi:hypothetical protein